MKVAHSVYSHCLSQPPQLQQKTLQVALLLPQHPKSALRLQHSAEVPTHKQASNKSPNAMCAALIFMG